MILGQIIKYRFLIFAVLLSFIAVANLTTYGIPPTHDGEYHVLRFQQFYKVLSEGTLYPRWAPDFNNGYGIPLFNYVYPLPNYAASFFHFLGFGFIDSFKLNMIAATLFGAVFMFLWVRDYFGQWGGLVSSVFYSFSPYHLLDIYVRGSVGEVWSLAFAPGLLWAYTRYFQTKKISYYSLSVIFLAFLIFSHNILALVFFVFFLAYTFFLISVSKSKKNVFSLNLRNLCLIIALGLGISSIFWLPAIIETGYVIGLQVFNPAQHFPKLHSLIYSSWGYGFSGKNVTDQMSFQIGLANLAVAGISLISLFFLKEKKLIIFFLVSLFITVFLITPFSSFLWKNIPFIAYIQFPWRFLSLVILICSFLAGLLISEKVLKSNTHRMILAIILILFSIILSLNYIKAPFYHPRDDSYYFSRRNFTDGTNSPGNTFNTINFNPSLKKTVSRLSSKNTKIQIFKNKSTTIEAFVEAQKKEKILVNIAYFPGWEVFVNNKKVPINVTAGGLFEFEVPLGDSKILVELKNTRVRLISVILTIFSSSLLFGLFVRDKYIKIKE